MLGTVIIEKFLDVVAYLLLFVLLLLLMPLPAWVSESASALLLVGIVLGGGILALLLQRDRLPTILEWLMSWLPAHLRARVLRIVKSALTSVDILKQHTDVAKLSFWTLVVWITAVLTNYLTLLALAIHLPLAASILILVVLQVGISLPSVPGRIGIFELGCILALAVFGVEQATALSYGLVLHAIVLLPTTLIGLLFFWMLGLASTPPPREHLVYEGPQQEV